MQPDAMQPYEGEKILGRNEWRERKEIVRSTSEKPGHRQKRRKRLFSESNCK